MKYLKYKLFVLILGLMITSCSNWLEMNPINQTTSEGFWINENAAEQTLAGAYALLRKALLNNGGETFLTYGELNGTTFKHKDQTDTEKFVDGSFWNPNMGEFQWANFYKITAQCNLILLKAAELDVSLFKNGEKGKQKILGEAYFLRAFTYFYMVKVWGDVPLVITSLQNVSEVITKDGAVLNVPRDPEAKVLEQCISDLKLAESYLVYGTEGSDEWAVRANKGTVEALMAHIYLWMHKSAEAELAADAVITKGGYSLVDYSDSLAVEGMFTGRSSEGILELNSRFDQSESIVDGIANRTVYHPWIYNKKEEGGTWVVQKEYMSSLYEENDLRLKRFFGFWNQERPIILKYAQVIYENPAIHLNPHGNNNVILLRLSDIILLRAEALTNLGRFAEATTLLNTIRNRAMVTPFAGADSDLKLAIFQEREMELIGEGHAYFDRIRSNEWSDISWMTATRKGLKGYYWPIAASYITNNPKLTQQSYWATKVW